MMELTGKDVKNIRLYLKMHAKNFGKNAGLTGSHISVSVYRWEHGSLKLSSKTLAGIKKMFFSKRLISFMEVLAHNIAAIEKVPEKIDFIFYPDEEIYQYFHGENAPPFLLYQETNKKIIEIIRNLGVPVSLVEITKTIYIRWLEKEGLEDNQESRTLFVINKETIKSQY